MQFKKSYFKIIIKTNETFIIIIYYKVAEAGQD
jgi:hypothetical protein